MTIASIAITFTNGTCFTISGDNVSILNRIQGCTMPLDKLIQLAEAEKDSWANPSLAHCKKCNKLAILDEWHICLHCKP